MPDEKKAKATVKTSKKSWIPPLLDNFKRTKKGQQLIRQELMVLLQEEQNVSTQEHVQCRSHKGALLGAWPSAGNQCGCPHGEGSQIFFGVLCHSSTKDRLWLEGSAVVETGISIFWNTFFSKKRDVLFFCFVPFLEEDAQKPPKKNMALEAMRTMKDDGSTRELNGLVAQIVAIGSNPGGEIAEESENASD